MSVLVWNPLKVVITVLGIVSIAALFGEPGRATDHDQGTVPGIVLQPSFHSTWLGGSECLRIMHGRHMWKCECCVESTVC
jgi:hypothetical protein